MQQVKRKESAFSAKHIAKMAILTALAYLISFLEFPIFPATPFLKLDFGNVFILLSGFLFGPVQGVIICLVKELLSVLTTQSFGVGQLANFLVTTAFILIPSVTYRFKKGLPIVIVTLVVACLVQTAAGLLINRFINYPLFYGETAAENFSLQWPFILGFNLIKSVAISVITILLYKRIEKLLAKF